MPYAQPFGTLYYLITVGFNILAHEHHAYGFIKSHFILGIIIKQILHP